MPAYKHFFLSNTSTAKDYTATGVGSGTFRSPPRDSRDSHGSKLLSEFEAAKAESVTRNAAAEPNSADMLFVPLAIVGTIGEFEGKNLSGLDLDKLQSDSKEIRIVNVREEGNRQIATVALPKDQLDYFEKKITDYISKDAVRTKKDGSQSSKPANQRLVESISELRLAALPDFYTDRDDNFPASDECIWWEVWLEFLQTDDEVNAFINKASDVGLEFSERHVRFPEVVVVLARGTIQQWTQVEGLFRNLAEFRRAKIVSSDFIDLPPSDQAEYINGLLERTSFADSDAPAVTILDTGVNRGHTLLAPALDQQDTQTSNPNWSSSDIDGHGTGIAGVALFGDRLKDLLYNSETVALTHRLESVKILPDDGANDPPDYGPITVGAMELARATSPTRSRVYCMAVTADDKDQFLPTLWSAAIDQAVSGRDDDRRKFISISAGNLLTQPGEDYPDANHLASVQDPAQSWNALTVGACTDLVQVQEEDFEGWNPVAPKGRLSPSSTTSVGWRKKTWPIKPELVLEGGNYATDGHGNYSDTVDLSILTTRLDATGVQLGLTRDTSPAAAQAARMAAIIQAEYPDYWPETLRAILVHSATWTKEMKKEFPVLRKSGKVKKIPATRLRAYGWGVPNLERGLACGKHFATMVIQDYIQPYCFGDDGKPKTKQMKFHTLPLPKEKLNEIGDEKVRMRVTLSYYIQPSPGRKGWNVKHRYASHGLRFEVIRPLETLEEFQRRVSRDFWDGAEDGSNKRVRPAKGPADDRHWAIGEFGQTKGSVHSDFWLGTASQLAESDSIAIFPITGWWRERPSQKCVEIKTRYSLVVTIETKKSEIEVYNWVATEVGIPIAVETEA